MAHRFVLGYRSRVFRGELSRIVARLCSVAALYAQRPSCSLVAAERVRERCRDTLRGEEHARAEAMMGEAWYKTWWIWAIVAAVMAVAALISCAALFAMGSDAEARERQAVIEGYAGLHEELFPQRFPRDSITVSEQDGFIEIARRQESGRASELGGSPSYAAEDQLAADMLASQMGCPVLVCDYLADGLLFSMQVGLPDAQSRQSGGAFDEGMQARMDEIAAAADAFAEGERERILQERCAGFLSGSYAGPGYADASYSIEPDGIWVNVTEAPGFGFRAYKTDDEYAEALGAWTRAAQADTRYLRQDVGYRFYTSAGELDLEAVAPMVDYLLDPRAEADA